MFATKTKGRTTFAVSVGAKEEQCQNIDKIWSRIYVLYSRLALQKTWCFIFWKFSGFMHPSSGWISWFGRVRLFGISRSGIRGCSWHPLTVNAKPDVWTCWVILRNCKTTAASFGGDKNGGGVCAERARTRNHVTAPASAPEIVAAPCFWSVSSVPSVLLHHIRCAPYPPPIIVTMWPSDTGQHPDVSRRIQSICCWESCPLVVSEMIFHRPV